jgi:hypothetical protein
MKIRKVPLFDIGNIEIMDIAEKESVLTIMSN